MFTKASLSALGIAQLTAGRWVIRGARSVVDFGVSAERDEPDGAEQLVLRGGAGRGEPVDPQPRGPHIQVRASWVMLRARWVTR